MRVAPQDVVDALVVAIDQRTDEQKKTVTDYFKTVSPLIKRQQERVASLEASHSAYFSQPDQLVATIRGLDRP